MRVAVDAARRVAPQLLRHRRVRIGVLAERVHLLLAEEAVAAGDGERHHHAIPWAQVPDVAANIDHLAHELVAEDVALHHPGNEAAVEIQVRAADPGRGDAPDSVARIKDLPLRHGLDAYVELVVPAACVHLSKPLSAGPPLGPW